MKFKCPGCGLVEEFEEDVIGTLTMCINCGTEYVVGKVNVDNSVFRNGDANVECPYCGVVNLLPMEAANRNVRCYNCNQKFHIALVRSTRAVGRLARMGFTPKRFCQDCGSQIDGAVNICPKCGVPIAGKSVAPMAESVPNHLVGAILTALFCCQIGGIVAIIYAAQVNTKLALGDIEGARAASKTASTWIAVNICIGVLVGIVYFIIGFAGAM